MRVYHLTFKKIIHQRTRTRLPGVHHGAYLDVYAPDIFQARDAVVALIGKNWSALWTDAGDWPEIRCKHRLTRIGVLRFDPNRSVGYKLERIKQPSALNGHADNPARKATQHDGNSLDAGALCAADAEVSLSRG
jgi:hypothetical protein